MAVDALQPMRAVAARFDLPGRVQAAEPLARGYIHDSYVLTVGTRAALRRFLLQRINTDVFPRPAEVMGNIRRVTEHMRRRLEAESCRDAGRRVLTLVPTRGGKAFCRDEAGSYWRIYHFVEGTTVLGTVRVAEHAYQAGLAVGTFQRLLADLPRPRLHETIPYFHHTPRRYEALERAIAADDHARVEAAAAEIAFARQRRDTAGLLVAAQERGEIPERVVHGDPKINNILFDAKTREAVCVVDLDTVMPGRLPCDFGDMVRSMTCTAPEDTTDLARVEMQPVLFEALTGGYLTAASELLTPAERDLLATAGKVITLEQGVRFLTDYLTGDRYYKTDRPGHNLDRCRTQFRLLASIERHEARLAEFVRDWKPDR